MTENSPPDPQHPSAAEPPPARSPSPRWRGGALTFAAVAVGSLLGLFAPTLAAWLPSAVGDLFIRLLKLIAPPLVLFACLRAILELGDLGRLRRLGGRAALYYLSTSLLAALAGVAASLLFLGSAAYAPAASTPSAPPFEGGRFIERLVPGDLLSPLLNGEILQLILLAVAIALLALRRPPAEQARLRGAVELLDGLCNDAARAVLWLTPLAALCISAELTRTLDWATFAPFTRFIWAWGAATLLHSLLTLPLLLWLFTGQSPLRFFLAVREALLVALTTASSAGTLPASKEVLERRAGVSRESASFILPLGATLNMDGSALYQAQLLLFMCAAEGRPLSAGLIVTVTALVLFSSAGTSAIPRGGIAMMGMMIAYLNLPPLYLGLYLAIDQLLDYPITAVNVWGDLVGTKLIDARLRGDTSDGDSAPL